MFDNKDFSSYGWKKPQPSKPRKEKAVEPLKAARNCRIGGKELVKGEPVTGLSEKQIKLLKKRGLLK